MNLPGCQTEARHTRSPVFYEKEPGSVDPFQCEYAHVHNVPAGHVMYIVLAAYTHALPYIYNYILYIHIYMYIIYRIIYRIIYCIPPLSLSLRAAVDVVCCSAT
jgi:hypothetical protein